MYVFKENHATLFMRNFKKQSAIKIGFVPLCQDEPFTSHLPEALFNMARFLLHHLINDAPVGVSKVYPLSIGHYS